MILQVDFTTFQDDAEIVIKRPKDLQDNATPSGNAMAAEALLKLAAFTENEIWQNKAEKMLGLVTNFSAEHPTAFSRWLSAADFFTNKIKQVAVVGNLDETRTMALLTEIRKSITLI